MDELLAKLGSAMGYTIAQYAVRRGVAMTSTFAINQCTRLLRTVDDKSLYADLKSLQRDLNHKIRVSETPLYNMQSFKLRLTRLSILPLSWWS